MSKYKVVVYAICKNESKFVKRWIKSMSEADDIYVLDTGSTDDTVSKLKKLKAKVHTKNYKNFRFDTARNDSLEFVPKDADICVCTDLDEIFDKGWRKKLEEIWQSDTTRCRYNYNWSLDKNNTPIINFYIEKIHKRNGYKWTHPVHEVLSYDGKEIYITVDAITLNHYPDTTKPRSSYLPLLELSVKESPNDDRNMHYLGREYMYYGKWNESIDTLIKHLNLESATWRDERCASMRFIARCYTNLNRFDEAEMWLLKAVNEAPYLRDAYAELVMLYYSKSNWDKLIYFGEQALEIKSHPKTYINEPISFNGTIEDVLSIAYFYKQNYDKALKYIDEALILRPNDERLINNKKLYESKLNTL